ncbi:MAG: LuxR C-terminal-related transcriptional regulator [Catalinimonas sp.]
MRYQRPDEASEDVLVRKYPLDLWNGVPLSKREPAVLRLLTAGRTAAEIGRALGVGQQMVSVHRRNLMRKFGAKSLAEMCEVAVRAALAEPPTS